MTIKPRPGGSNRSAGELSETSGRTELDRQEVASSVLPSGAVKATSGSKGRKMQPKVDTNEIGKVSVQKILQDIGVVRSERGEPYRALSPASSREPSLDQMQADTIQRAVEVIGDKAEALRWMGAPVRALNYATPISLLHNHEGYKAVLTILGRLEHGIP